MLVLMVSAVLGHTLNLGAGEATVKDFCAEGAVDQFDESAPRGPSKFDGRQFDTALPDPCFSGAPMNSGLSP
jgi:hypothetical protein